MGGITFQRSPGGFQRMLASAEAAQATQAAAEIVAARAGEGFETGGRTGTRARAWVRAATYRARRAAADHALERAVGGGL